MACNHTERSQGMTNEYDDIIHLPHHVSPHHRPMSMQNRAAQFAPFAALTGHDAALRETARLTDAEVELVEDSRLLLDRRMEMLRAVIPDCPIVTITYFKPDSRKAGGSYVSVTGSIAKIDDYAHLLTMTDGSVIPLSTIVAIDGEIFLSGGVQ